MSLKNQDIKINQVVAKKVVEQITHITQVDSIFEVIKKTRKNIEYDAFKKLPLNLGAMYQSAAETYGTADFIIYKNERHSFADLYQHAAAFSLVLQNDFNIVSGDKVVIAMRNYPDWIIAFMGITMLG
ncbi:MAG: long-chain acyl-CoA synthetase, partial [Colwellia sp.]